MLKEIKSSRILVMPSRHETFGIVGLEAMALGKPVIVYDEAGGPLDYVKNGHNGMVVSARPEALRIAANELLEDEELLNEMGKNALETAKKNSWKEVAERVKEFYKSLLEKNGPALFYRNR